jgi:hypothetical protein
VPEHARCPSGATPVIHAEPGLEVAEIFRRYLAPLRDKHVLGPVEDRIARDVMAVETGRLGDLGTGASGRNRPISVK